MLPSASRWKGAGASAVLTMAMVALAYWFPTAIEIDLGRGVEGVLGSSGFYDTEGSYRWSRARGEIVFPDPGARNPVRLEPVLSGFRPPGAEPPRVAIEAGGRSLTLPPSRRIETYSLETSTEGIWSSSSRVQIRSDTFVPGGGDESALGVRVHRARLILDGPFFPPLKQILASGTAAALLALYLGAPGATALGVLLGLGFLFFRFYAALIAPALVVGALTVILVARFLPGPTKFAGEISRGFGRALLDEVRGLRPGRGGCTFPRNVPGRLDRSSGLRCLVLMGGLDRGGCGSSGARRLCPGGRTVARLRPRFAVPRPSFRARSAAVGLALGSRPPLPRTRTGADPDRVHRGRSRKKPSPVAGRSARTRIVGAFRRCFPRLRSRPSIGARRFGRVRRSLRRRPRGRPGVLRSVSEPDCARGFGVASRGVRGPRHPDRGLEDRPRSRAFGRGPPAR